MRSARSIIHRTNYARPLQERRIAKRITGNVPVKLRFGTREESAVMVDVSFTGFRLRGPQDMKLPRSVALYVTALNFEVRSSLVWRSGEYSGWRFAFEGRQSAQIRTLIQAQNLSRILKVSAVIKGGWR